MRRKSVQQARSQICSVKLPSFKRNVSAAQECKGKAYQPADCEWSQRPTKVVTYSHSHKWQQVIFLDETRKDVREENMKNE